MVKLVKHLISDAWIPSNGGKGSITIVLYIPMNVPFNHHVWWWKIVQHGENLEKKNIIPINFYDLKSLISLKPYH